jgi:hypothetical protein
MSVLDKWLGKYGHNSEAATSATSATNPNGPYHVNWLDSATETLQGCYKPGTTGDVATLSQPIYYRKASVIQTRTANVADVADVATPEFRPTATVMNFSGSASVCGGSVCLDSGIS